MMTPAPHPPEDPSALHRRLTWARNALEWSGTCRRLLGSGGYGEAHLAFVALHICVQLTAQLLDGFADVYEDEVARATCPEDPRSIRRLRDKLTRIRNEMRHFVEHGEGDAWITARYSDVPPHLTLEASRTRSGQAADELTIGAVLRLLDSLDPWLESQVARLEIAAGT